MDKRSESKDIPMNGLIGIQPGDSEDFIKACVKLRKALRTPVLSREEEELKAFNRINIGHTAEAARILNCRNSDVEDRIEKLAARQEFLKKEIKRVKGLIQGE